MINRVVLVGRLTSDIELKKTGTGLSVASFTVACNRRFTQGQDRQADFINCVAWRQTAEFLSNYARKGSLVGVEGRIQTRNYEDKDGKRVYVTEIVSDSVQMLESKQASENRSGSMPSGNSFDQGNFDQNNFGAQNNSFSLDDGPVLDISSDDLPF